MNKKNTETYTDIYGIFPGKQDNASPHSALQPHHCRRNMQSRSVSYWKSMVQPSKRLVDLS